SRIPRLWCVTPYRFDLGKGAAGTGHRRTYLCRRGCGTSASDLLPGPHRCALLSERPGTFLRVLTGEHLLHRLVAHLPRAFVPVGPGRHRLVYDTPGLAGREGAFAAMISASWSATSSEVPFGDAVHQAEF